MTDDDEREAMREAGEVFGEWVAAWAKRIADGVTVVDDGAAVRFTPGLLPTLHAQVSELPCDSVRYALVAAVMLAASAMADE